MRFSSFESRANLGLPSLALLAVLALAACGDDSPAGGSGAGGDSPGGSDQGGQGGVASGPGGNGEGGDAQGGDAPGGNAQGGNAQGGQGGGRGCTEITIGAFAVIDADGTGAAYGATPTPNAGGAEQDALTLELFGSALDPQFNGELSGSFDLTMAGDANYATCSRCVAAFEDPSIPGKAFFQSAGTLEIAAASDQLNGIIDATLTDVTLIEVTIDPVSSVSTPVPGGECLHIASAPVLVAATSTVAQLCQTACAYLAGCASGDPGTCVTQCSTDLGDCSLAQLGEVDSCNQVAMNDCDLINNFSDCLMAVACLSGG